MGLRIGEHTGSEIVADLAKSARVVKRFNTLPIEQFFRPAPKGMRRVTFLAGDDRDAKRVVAALVESIGLASADVGPLRADGKLMELRGALYNKRLLREPC